MRVGLGLGVTCSVTRCFRVTVLPNLSLALREFIGARSTVHFFGAERDAIGSESDILHYHWVELGCSRFPMNFIIAVFKLDGPGAGGSHASHRLTVAVVKTESEARVTRSNLPSSKF